MTTVQCGGAPESTFGFRFVNSFLNFPSGSSNPRRALTRKKSCSSFNVVIPSKLSLQNFSTSLLMPLRKRDLFALKSRLAKSSKSVVASLLNSSQLLSSPNSRRPMAAALCV